MSKDVVIPVILSGGVGARLWPVSRELHPKPFLRLGDGQSLLQKTFARAAGLPSVAEILTVTNRDLLVKTEEEYRSVNPKALPTSHILEPCGRNTAAAIAVAAVHLAGLYGDAAILVVMPADHLVTNQAAFAQAVSRAAQLTRQEFLVTFGIRPHAPETGYGYIEIEGQRVKRYVEKPSLDKAKEYIAAGSYLWNAGIFCFTAGTLMAQMAIHAPEILVAARNCLAVSKKIRCKESIGVELDFESFKRAPDISIDYALMERSTRIAVVPCDIGWSDIGSWSAISELTEADADGNGIVGQARLFESTDCYIQNQSEGRIIAAVGVKNIAIIDTPDALLVVEKSHDQDVKPIVAQLKAEAHDAYRLHREVHRPWGVYTVIETGKNFKIKRIVVKPGASLSLQMHRHRSEHWVVVSGVAEVVCGARQFLVNINESTFIPQEQKHRLKNPGEADLIMIEVQSGDYLGEDDIVRFDDDYGRAGG